LQIKKYFTSVNIYNDLLSKVPHLDTKLFSKDTFFIKDYNPLINQRAHKLNADSTGASNILNQSLKCTYSEFLLYLTWKRHYTIQDYMILISYLLFEDRLHEALGLWEKFETLFPGDTKFETDGSLQIQYDYMKAYMSLYSASAQTGDFEVSKDICMKYIGYPVLFWRNMFVAIANQLAEIEDTDKLEMAEMEDSNLALDNAVLVDREESLEAEVISGELRIEFRNVGQVEIKYFKTDMEILFSKNPFL
jgi:hypothetical protein